MIYIPNTFTIELINICKLNCEFCHRLKINDPKMKVLPFESFKIIIDKCTEFGIYSFELTPPKGEPLLVPNLHLYMDYLENHPKVKNYFFFTGLISKTYNEEELELIFRNRKKFYAVISVYSLNERDFHLRTNSKHFKLFFKNFKYLLKNNFENLSIRNRTKSNIDNALFTSYYKKYDNNDNRIKFERLSIDTTQESKSDKVCSNLFINNGCYINGDITHCIYGDTFCKNIIGNIFNDNLKEVFKDFEQNIKDNKICNNCIVYNELEDYDEKSIINIIDRSYDYKHYITDYNWRIGNNDTIK